MMQLPPCLTHAAADRGTQSAYIVSRVSALHRSRDALGCCVMYTLQADPCLCCR